MAFSLKDIIFKFFGTYYSTTDINKDVAGKGTLERFNELVAEEYDTELQPLIDELVTNNLVPSTAFDRFVPLLEQRLGNTLVLGNTLDSRRRVLKYLHRWYSIKGTIRAYELLLGLLGFTVVIVEDFTKFGFDSPVTFDDPKRVFDLSCDTCGNYCVELTGSVLITAEVVQAIFSIIEWNEPIHAQLEKVTVNGIVITPETEFLIQPSMLFDGIDERILAPTDVAFDLERTDPFTFIIWARPVNLLKLPMFSKRDAGDGYEVWLEAGRLFLELRSGAFAVGTTLRVESEINSYVIDTWQMFAVTHDGSGTLAGVTLTVNNLPKVVTSNTGRNVINSGTIIHTEPFFIGHGIAGNHFKGHLVEFRFWDKVLTPAKILTEYASGFTLGIPFPPVDLVDVVVWNRLGIGAVFVGGNWEFTDDSGNVAIFISEQMEQEDLVQQG